MRTHRTLIATIAAVTLLATARGGEDDDVTVAPEQPTAEEPTEGSPEESAPEPTEEPVEPTEEPPVEEPPTEEPPAEEPPAEEPPTEEPPTEEPPTEEPEEPTEGTGGSDTVDFDLGEVTAPGTTLAVGDSALTIDGARDSDGNLNSQVIVRSTVVDIGRFEENVFEDADNAEEFEGYYPWYVVMEYEYIAFEDEPETRLPAIGAFDSTDTRVAGVRGSAFSRIPVQGCDEAPSPSAEVGAIGMQCDTYMVPEDDEIATIQWTGSVVTETDGTFDYSREPIVWGVEN